MEIFNIFAPRLSAFRFEPNDKDEFHRLFNNWYDPEYLRNFFNENIRDLNSGFFGRISVDEAVRKTYKWAQELQDRIYQLANNPLGNLDELFEPLSENESFKPSRAKAKQGRWLRVYAVKVESNVYVVTGGAIKLTSTMRESYHLRVELEKLGRGRDFLIENGIYDIDGLTELII